MDNIIRLNGQWFYGYRSKCDQPVAVPGMIGEPDESAKETIWLKKHICMPEGDYTRASLLLKGARFRPKVYIDGAGVSERGEGGMTPTWHLLDSRDVRPGSEFDLQVVLIAHKHNPELDASYISDPEANIASCIWDDVEIWTHNNVIIESIRPFTDHKRSILSVEVRAQLASLPIWPWPPRKPTPEIGAQCRLTATLYENNGGMLISRTVNTDQKITSVELPLTLCKTWTPDSPTFYRLSVSMDDGTGPSERTICYGYSPAGETILRSITYTWPFWLRGDAKSYIDAYDVDIFWEKVIRPLKEAGGNTIFFDKALPPERLLDACDKAGLFVGLEFPYFRSAHSIVPSQAAQWRWFLDLAISHPCVCFVEPWEGDDELLTEIRSEYSRFSSGRSAKLRAQEVFI